jgi:hypothetical protein
VPGGSLTDGLDRLAQNIAALRDMAPEELCDDLLSDASQQSLRDDVALLVVRLSQAAATSGVDERATRQTVS